MPRTQDLHVSSIEPLISPAELKAALPASDAQTCTVAEARDAIRDILFGRDERRLVIVGPCSIHDPAAAREYADRLAALRDRLQDTFVVVMRVYFEKPRTKVGWKGLIYDPHLDDSSDMALGLRLARELLLDITDRGLPTATEFLDPIVPQYIADLVSWAAIGARTTESQTHRQMASGLSMPVGFKNGTDGTLTTALNACESGLREHAFLGIDQKGQTALVHTTGNPDCHIVLRGGAGRPNFHADDIRRCEEQLRQRGLRTRILVDCSHDQTGKDYRLQPKVLENLVGQIRDGNTSVAGFMLESNLCAGNQPIDGDRAYGVSITDGCIDWATTEACLDSAAEVLAGVRA